VDHFLARRTISDAPVFSFKAARKGNLDMKRRDEQRGGENNIGPILV
jgi:hypothetical protein